MSVGGRVESSWELYPRQFCIFSERQSEWVTPRLSPGRQCSLQQGFCVWRTVPPGPLSQVTWEPERDASDLQSVVSWWGSVLGTRRIWCWSGGECTIKYPPSLSCYLILSLYHCSVWPRKISSCFTPCDILTCLYSPEYIRAHLLAFFCVILWMSFLLKMWLFLTPPSSN